MKTPLLKSILLSLIAVFLSSCYSTKMVSLQSDYEHACKGLTKAEIIEKFGDPTREAVINGVKAMIYESFVTPEQGTKQNSIKYAGQWIESRKYLEIYLGEDNICCKVETNLTKETRFKDEKKTNRVVWGTVAGVSVAAAVGTVLALLLPETIRRNGSK